MLQRETIHGSTPYFLIETGGRVSAASSEDEGSRNAEYKEQEFIRKFNEAVLVARVLAKQTFALLACQLNPKGVVCAVESAASTHATLGGNLATAAEGVARAVDSATSITCKQDGCLSQSFGGAELNADTGVVREEYVSYFRSLLLTMLGELPRKGHLLSDFHNMFNIDYEKIVYGAQFAEISRLMSKIREDWTCDEFLGSSPIITGRIRENLLRVAEILNISERIPTNFAEDDLEVVPHIELLNDFMRQLLRRMGEGYATYIDGIEANPGILGPAKEIIKGHRNTGSPIAFKLLRTAFLENTAQARIQGLKLIASKYDLDQHPYLVTHAIVEEFHGREALEQLRAFVKAGDTSIEQMEEYLGSIMTEISRFYSCMEQCADSCAPKQ